jgi:hypothetical protein
MSIDGLRPAFMSEDACLGLDQGDGSFFDLKLSDWFRTREVPITLNERVFAVVTKTLQLIATLATGASLYMLEFTDKPKLAFGSFCLGLTFFSAYFSIDKSFYSFIERREKYHSKLGQIALIDYFKIHGFDRIMQYGLNFDGPCPLLSKEEFSSHLRASQFDFKDPKVREFIIKCAQENLLSTSDFESIEEQFTQQVSTFEQAINRGFLDLIELGFFEDSMPLMRRIYSLKSWDRMDLFFQHFDKIQKAHLLPKRLPGLAATLVTKGSEHTAYKQQLKKAYEQSFLEFESKQKDLKKNEEELTKKASSGYFIAHPEEIHALDCQGLLKEGFDSVDFYSVVRAHIKMQREEAESLLRHKVAELEDKWSAHLKHQIEALKGYKDLAEIAFSFDEMSLENFLSTYGQKRISNLMQSSHLALSREEISMRLFHDLNQRKKLLDSDLTLSLMKSHLLSDRAKLTIEKLLLQPEKFTVIAGEGYIFKFLDQGVLSKNTLYRIEALVSRAIISASGSELLLYWKKIRQYKLASNPELEPLYAWLSSQEKGRTQSDEEFRRLRERLGIADVSAYPIKEHPYGNAKLSDDRNLLVFT